MLHPSYADLMKVVNSEVEEGEQPVVNSRYSIVIATAKRARQIIDGSEPLVEGAGKKPLSIAIEELNESKVKIVTEAPVEAPIEDEAPEVILDDDPSLAFETKETFEIDETE